MKTILFSRPSHDDITAYLHLFSKHLVKLAFDKGYRVSDQEKEKANKLAILSVINKMKPNFIMFNGHGNSKEICGHNDETVIKAGKNHKLLSSSIVYSLSCSSAQELGPVSVEDGAVAFIGYDDDFALGTDTRYETTPSRDKVAKLFLDPSNLLVETLLKGNSIKVAMERCKTKMEENISQLRTSTEPEAADYLPWLFYNCMSLVAHGNKDATI